MKRRQFMHTLAALGAIGNSGTLAAGSAVSDLSVLTTPGLTTFLGDHDCIRRIGLAYRERFADENSVDVLARKILREHSSGQNPATMIDNAIAQDFSSDNTVLLHGWLLSRTEARQAALYSLLHS